MPDCYRRSARRWVDTADPAEAAALAAGYAALLDDFPPSPADGDEAASLDRLVEAVRTVSSTWASRRSAIVASETVTDPASSKRKERRRLRRSSAAESAAAGSTPPRECRRRRAYGATTNGSSPPVAPSDVTGSHHALLLQMLADELGCKTTDIGAWGKHNLTV